MFDHQVVIRSRDGLGRERVGVKMLGEHTSSKGRVVTVVVRNEVLEIRRVTRREHRVAGIIYPGSLKQIIIRGKSNIS